MEWKIRQLGLTVAEFQTKVSRIVVTTLVSSQQARAVLLATGGDEKRARLAIDLTVAGLPVPGLVFDTPEELG